MVFFGFHAIIRFGQSACVCFRKTAIAKAIDGYKNAASLTGTVANSSNQAVVSMPQQQYELLDAADSPRELKPLEWRVRVHKRARNLSLHIEPNGSVRVTVPPRTRPYDIAAFVQENADWIAKAQDYFARRVAAQPVLPDTIELRALGLPVSIEYKQAKRARWQLTDEQLLLSSPQLDAEHCWPLLQDYLKKTARNKLVPLINDLANQIKLKPKKVQVRLQKSRWGSCSSRRTVSLNAALLLRRPAEVRYLMVHELCHLQHMNHSPRFWRLVESFEPDYQSLDKALNEAWRETPHWLLG